MNAPSSSSATTSTSLPAAAPRRRRPLRILILAALACSLLLNGYQYQQRQDYYAYQQPPREMFHSGSRDVRERILLLRIRGTIMPPFTERILKSIKRAAEDNRVKGILLSIDSPGGLVADSHQIYHALTEIRETKPIYVQMKRMAASGGYYIAMGAGSEGQVFAEPTTWTGSIGVIIPRWDVSEMIEKIGVKTDSLKTGKFKDTLNPMSELTPDERQLWDTILDESFERFVGVIADNRPLNNDQVKQLATGQIYTANQALENGLIDKIGFEEQALKALQDKLGLSEVRVVTYDYAPTWYDLLSPYIKSEPASTWQQVQEATVPQALYYCSWTPGIPYAFQSSDETTH